MSQTRVETISEVVIHNANMAELLRKKEEERGRAWHKTPHNFVWLDQGDSMFLSKDKKRVINVRERDQGDII